VLLMMEQNIGIWLWHANGPLRFANHPFFYSLNGIGGLAGPLFITMAGTGSALLEQRHAAIDRTLLLRGLGIMLCGYLMNAITPGLFSLGSWFTLQMIGFAIMSTPFYRRMTTPQVLLLALAVVLATGGLHHLLDTPLRLSVHRMRTGTPWRLMLAESYYSVFPWLAFYLAGYAMGRLYIGKQNREIIRLAWVSLLAGGCGAFFSLLPFAQKGLPHLYLRLNLGFFPTPPLFVLLLFPVIVLSFFAFQWLARHWSLSEHHFLVCLGRLSLTLQIVHVFLFYEVSQRMGWFRAFSTPATAAILMGFLSITALMAVGWRKGRFRYSGEWVLRRWAG